MIFIIFLLAALLTSSLHASNIRVFLPNYYEQDDEFKERARNTAQIITPKGKLTACVKFTNKGIEPNDFDVAFGDKKQQKLFRVRSKVTKLDVANGGNLFNDYVRRKQADECLFYFHPFLARVAGIRRSRSIPFVIDSLDSFPRDPLYDAALDPYGMGFHNAELKENKRRMSSNIFFVETQLSENLRDEFEFVAVNKFGTKRIVADADRYMDAESYDKDSIVSKGKNLDISQDTQKSFKVVAEVAQSSQPSNH